MPGIRSGAGAFCRISSPYRSSRSLPRTAWWRSRRARAMTASRHGGSEQGAADVAVRPWAGRDKVARCSRQGRARYGGGTGWPCAERDSNAPGGTCHIPSRNKVYPVNRPAGRRLLVRGDATFFLRSPHRSGIIPYVHCKKEAPRGSSPARGATPAQRGRQGGNSISQEPVRRRGPALFVFLLPCCITCQHMAGISSHYGGGTTRCAESASQFRKS